MIFSPSETETKKKKGKTKKRKPTAAQLRKISSHHANLTLLAAINSGASR